MQDEAIIDGEKYISSKRARKISGYSTDYIGQLARKGQIDSKMFGRNRYVSESSLVSYIESVKNNNEESEKKSSEPVVSNIPIKKISGSPSHKDHKSFVSQTYIRPARRIEKEEGGFKKSLGIAFASAAVLLLTFGVFAFTDSNLKNNERTFVRSEGQDVYVNRNLSSNQATVSESLNKSDRKIKTFFSQIDNFVISILSRIRANILAWLDGGRRLVTGEGASDTPNKNSKEFFENQKNSFEERITESNSSTTERLLIDEETFRNIVREVLFEEADILVPGGPFGGVATIPSSGDPATDEIIINRVQDAFSDEVRITLDEGGTTGVLRPVFRDGETLDESYLFVLVPTE